MYGTHVIDLDIQIVQRTPNLENNSRVTRIKKWHLHYFIHQRKKIRLWLILILSLCT